MQESNNITNANQTLRNIAGKKSIITKSYAGNEGKIVTCIRLATEDEVIRAWFTDTEGPVWVVDTLLSAVIGDGEYLAIDACMTPLQDLDEPEQQVQELYAPSPKKETLTIKIDTTQLQNQLKKMLDNLK